MSQTHVLITDGGCYVIDHHNELGIWIYRKAASFRPGFSCPPSPLNSLHAGFGHETRHSLITSPAEIQIGQSVLMIADRHNWTATSLVREIHTGDVFNPYEVGVDLAVGRYLVAREDAAWIVDDDTWTARLAEGAHGEAVQGTQGYALTFAMRLD
ncbi:hypothetical protein [Microbacterium sp. A84]|uniref:hypothetical protein n=1 Tax=Microbacterium sp. A84 TaxID=3450715 RepID=UPI003F43DD01